MTSSGLYSNFQDVANIKGPVFNPRPGQYKTNFSKLFEITVWEL